MDFLESRTENEFLRICSFFCLQRERGPCLHLVMLACKASLSSTASSNMLSSTMLSKGFVSSSMRQLSSSTVRLGGQKAKRRKQTLRADNPHLPVR